MKTLRASSSYENPGVDDAWWAGSLLEAVPAEIVFGGALAYRLPSAILHRNARQPHVPTIEISGPPKPLFVFWPRSANIWEAYNVSAYPGALGHL